MVGLNPVVGSRVSASVGLGGGLELGAMAGMTLACDPYDRMTQLVARTLQPPENEDTDDKGTFTVGDTLGGASVTTSNSCNEMMRILCCMNWSCCQRTTENTVQVTVGDNGLEASALEKETALLSNIDKETLSGQIAQSHKALSDYLVTTYGQDLPFLYKVVVNQRQQWSNWDPTKDTTLTTPLNHGDVQDLLTLMRSAHGAATAIREALMKQQIEAMVRDGALPSGSPVVGAVAGTTVGVPPAAADASQAAATTPAGAGVDTHEKSSAPMTAASDAIKTSSGGRIGSVSTDSQSRMIKVILGGANSEATIPFSRKRLASDLRRVLECSQNDVEALVEEVIAALPDTVTTNQIWEQVRKKVGEKNYSIKEATTRDGQINRQLDRMKVVNLGKVSDLDPAQFVILMSNIGKST